MTFTRRFETSRGISSIRIVRIRLHPEDEKERERERFLRSRNLIASSRDDTWHRINPRSFHGGSGDVRPHTDYPRERTFNLTSLLSFLDRNNRMCSPRLCVYTCLSLSLSLSAVCPWASLSRLLSSWPTVVPDDGFTLDSAISAGQVSGKLGCPPRLNAGSPVTSNWIRGQLVVGEQGNWWLIATDFSI